MKKIVLLLTVAVLLLTAGCSTIKSENEPPVALPSEEVSTPISPAPEPSDEALDPPASEPSDETADPQDPITTEPTPETPKTDPPQDIPAFPYATALSDYWGPNLESVFPIAVCPPWLWIDPHECIPLPLLRIDTREALVQLQNQLKESEPDDPLPSFQKVTADCDSVFFENNSLVVIHIRSASCSYRYEAQVVEKRNGALSFTVAPEDITEGTILEWGEGNFLLTITVPKADLADCTQIYAHAYTLTPKLIES